MKERLSDFLDGLFQGRETTIALDLKLNLKKIVGESSLTEDQALVAFGSVAAAVNLGSVVDFASSELQAMGRSPEAIREVYGFTVDQVHDIARIASVTAAAGGLL